MAEATITFRVDEALKEAFSNAAKEKDRTGAQLLRDFMRDFVKRRRIEVEEEALFRLKAQRGLDDIAAGRVYTSEEMKAESKAWEKEVLRKLGERK